MTVLRIRFSRPGLVLLTFLVILLSGSHARLELPPYRPSSVEPIEFSFEEIDRQTIRSLIDEHRWDADAEWRQHVSGVIYDEAMTVGLDPLLVAAIVAHESSFRERVVSHAGAVGLMQLRPFVARDLARQADLEWRGQETLHRPELNVRLGVSYYRKLIHRFDGDAALALAAYHRGPTRLRRQLNRGTFDGSRYAQGVLGLYEALDARRYDPRPDRG